MSANIIGTGKTKYETKQTKFDGIHKKIGTKFGEVRKSLKCLSPTQSLPVIPFIGLKIFKKQ
ncbi:hypothetical protein GCM10020331_102690 [Ectobacillus funiculus]